MSAPFKFQPCSYCCTECEACKDNQYPQQLTIVFTGVQNSPNGPPYFNGCTDCANVNGPTGWVLTKNSNCISGYNSYGRCWVSGITYEGDFPAENMCTCAYQQATLTISLEIWWNYGGVPGKRVILVSIGNSRGCLAINFYGEEINQSEPLDCTKLNGVPVLTFSGGGAYCASPGATCSVHA